jgi:hypothetical protein
VSISPEQINEWHPRDLPAGFEPEVAADLREVRRLCNELAHKIHQLTPPGPPQLVAVHMKLVEVRLWTEEAVRSGGV